MPTYRVYAGTGSVVEEDLFEEYDNAQPYYDDYAEITVSDAFIAEFNKLPEELVHYLIEGNS